MAPGRPIVLMVLLAAMMFGEKFVKLSSGLSTPQSFSGVKIPGGHMELVEQETCSRGVIRLTCRSLRAFLLVLEAGYLADRSDLCGPGGKRYKKKKLEDKSSLWSKHLRGNYVDDDDKDGSGTPDFADLRLSLNRRCSGLQHCRFNVNLDHPEAAFWTPANIRLKYACIPEAAIGRYCNTKVKVLGGEGGYLKSPGYPHYYLGGSSCGWTFESQPGQRISLTLHDLNIRSAQQDGNCVDVLRVRENGITLLESCGTSAGVQVFSESNLVTLDLIALSKLYPSRGFLLQYRAIGCPEFQPPNGSYVINETDEVKTVLCKAGTVFPDTKIRSKSISCKNGMWSDEIARNCVDSTALIFKAENEAVRGQSSLSGEPGMGNVYVPANGVVERSSDAAAIPGPFGDAMEVGTTGEKGNYVIDIVLPSIFIALLFIGNAIIVYVIFQYRKRKQPPIGRGGREVGKDGEEMALRSTPEDIPQV